jgi:hypothetical protein
MSKGIYEMWNPLTGEGYGVKDLGMSTKTIIIYSLEYLKIASIIVKAI